MQALRPALRRPLPLVVRRSPALRFQHNYGPHKEYFQTPGKTPLPDTTPYDPSVPIETVVTNTGPSRTARAARSFLWATLFSTLGVAAGTALITWEYLQPPFEPGSPEEEELFAEILETLETHPLVDQLRSENWVEENFYNTRPHGGVDTGFNLVHEKLTGTQGLTIRAFRHPSHNYTILVLFAGFGVEGWPDVVHGGVITTLLLEAVNRHQKHYYSEFVDMDTPSISVDFKKPMRPGEIYAVLVPPAGLEEVPGDPQQKKLVLVSLLMRMEAAPRLGTQFDAATQTETHTVEIPTAGGQDMTHAVGRVHLPVMVRDPVYVAEPSIQKADEP
jgi:hypothetical protein